MAVTPEHRAFVEAGIGIVMAMIMADGDYAEAEFTWFKNAQARHPLFRDVPPEPFNAMLHRVKSQLLSQPWRGLVEQWASAVPADYKRAVFEMAAEVAVADRKLQGGETDVIRHLAQVLGISAEESQQILARHIQGM